MKIVCAECNTPKIVSNKKLIPYRGKTISTKCANKQCSYRIKFKVPLNLIEKNAQKENREKVKEKIRYQKPKVKYSQGKVTTAPEKKKTSIKKEVINENLIISEKPKSGLLLIVLMFLALIGGITILEEELKELLLIFIICCLLLLIMGSVIILSENKQNGFKTSKYSKVTRIIAVLLLSTPVFIASVIALIIAIQDFLNY